MSIFNKCNFIGNLLSILSTSIKSLRLNFNTINLFNHCSKNENPAPNTNESLNISMSLSEEHIEPHANLLTKPNRETLLYKIIPSHYFFDMLKNDYLYFRRVDTYNDDKNDSDLPPKDREMTEKIGFEKNPKFKVSNYYERCRSRTYACCFSTENTPSLWKNYGAQDPNSVCIIFDCDKLMHFLNQIYINTKMAYQEKRLNNIFYLNYGLVKYGNLMTDILAKEKLLNPIEYTYFKDAEKYSWENEFRISLSALGVSEKYTFSNNTNFTFSESLHLDFNYKSAIEKNVILSINLSEQHDKNFITKLKNILEQKKIVISQAQHK